MKPYFAKYLPVEGEIKEGDYFMDTAGNIRPADDMDVMLETYLTQRLPPQQKYQLFLCSRDIQVGDKLYPLEGAPDQKEGALLESAQDVAVFKFNEAFKVIGLISPEATWVKEGDEFEESEIELEYHVYAPPPNVDYIVSEDYYKSITDGKKYIIAKIKGLCNHFH